MKKLIKKYQYPAGNLSASAIDDKSKIRAYPWNPAMANIPGWEEFTFAAFPPNSSAVPEDAVTVEAARPSETLQWRYQEVANTEFPGKTIDQLTPEEFNQVRFKVDSQFLSDGSPRPDAGAVQSVHPFFDIYTTLSGVGAIGKALASGIKSVGAKQFFTNGIKTTAKNVGEDFRLGARMMGQVPKEAVGKEAWRIGTYNLGKDMLGFELIDNAPKYVGYDTRLTQAAGNKVADLTGNESLGNAAGFVSGFFIPGRAAGNALETFGKATNYAADQMTTMGIKAPAIDETINKLWGKGKGQYYKAKKKYQYFQDTRDFLRMKTLPDDALNQIDKKLSLYTAERAARDAANQGVLTSGSDEAVAQALKSLRSSMTPYLRNPDRTIKFLERISGDNYAEELSSILRDIRDEIPTVTSLKGPQISSHKYPIEWVHPITGKFIPFGLESATTYQQFNILKEFGSKLKLMSAQQRDKTHPLFITPEAQKEVNDYVNTIEGLLQGFGKVGGSTRLVGKIGYQHFPQGLEIVTTEDRVSELLNTMGQTYQDPSRPSNLKLEINKLWTKAPKGRVQIKVIGSAPDGRATGEVARQLYSILDPDGYAKWARSLMVDDVKKVSDLNTAPLPVKAEDLFQAQNKPWTINGKPTKFSTMDASVIADNITSLNPKHQQRSIDLLYSDDPELHSLMQDLITRKTKAQTNGAFKNSRELFPNVDLSNVEGNKEFLNLIGLPEDLATDPMKMRTVLDKWLMEETAARQLITPDASMFEPLIQHNLLDLSPETLTALRNEGRVPLEALSSALTQNYGSKFHNAYSGPGLNFASPNTSAFNNVAGVDIVAATPYILKPNPEIKTLGDVAHQYSLFNFASRPSLLPEQVEKVKLIEEAMPIDHIRTINDKMDPIQTVRGVSQDLANLNSEYGYGTPEYDTGVRLPGQGSTLLSRKAADQVSAVNEKVSQILGKDFIETAGYHVNSTPREYTRKGAMSNKGSYKGLIAKRNLKDYGVFPMSDIETSGSLYRYTKPLTQSTESLHTYPLVQTQLDRVSEGPVITSGDLETMRRSGINPDEPSTKHALAHYRRLITSFRDSAQAIEQLKRQRSRSVPLQDQYFTRIQDNVNHISQLNSKAKPVVQWIPAVGLPTAAFSIAGVQLPKARVNKRSDYPYREFKTEEEQKEYFKEARKATRNQAYFVNGKPMTADQIAPDMKQDPRIQSLQKEIDALVKQYPTLKNPRTDKSIPKTIRKQYEDLYGQLYDLEDMILQERIKKLSKQK